MTEKQFDRDMEIWLSKPENQERLGEFFLNYLLERLKKILNAEDIGP